MVKFSIVLIARNEVKTLPRLQQSLVDFQARGGEVVLLDTGSTDGTAELARSYGFKVTEVGDIYRHVVGPLADQINKRFVVGKDKNILVESDSYFDFSSARNHASSLASNDMVSFMDCDEAFTKLDIDKINDLIDKGFTQFEYNFIFSHDQFGNEAIRLVQSKFFDRRVVKWVGLVHEVLDGPSKKMFLPEDILKLEHWQNFETNRHSYLVGLAVDCYDNPGKDRNSHYFARELMWAERYESAIAEFDRHISMNAWLQEKAQSTIFVGDCLGKINDPDGQMEYYNRAFFTDCSRREALLRIANFYRVNDKPFAAAAYASASLEIPENDFYANNKADYTFGPHEILYWAKGWSGDIAGAQKHLLKALEYQPLNPRYLADTKFYFEYYDRGIEGWMQFPELQWLYNMAKQVLTIAEVGCWKGRSSHALASGTKGTLYAIDHWKGSSEALDQTNAIAKQEDVFKVFEHNMKDLKNVIVNKSDSVLASHAADDNFFDMTFIDAGHTYEEVKRDIEAWLPKTRLVICGDDYLPTVWPGVCKAVDEAFGKPDGIVGKVWYKFIGPKISFIIPTLGRPEGLKRCLDSIDKLVYPKELIEVVVIEDKPRLGVPKRVKQALKKTTGEYVVFAANDIEFKPESVLKALKHDKGLVSFNTGPLYADDGNICEHFIIKRDLIDRIGGDIFDTDFHHVGCDNLLWAKCDSLQEATRADDAVVKHYHFSKGTAPMDEVYKEGWSHAEEDRMLLKAKLNWWDNENS